MKEGCCCLRSVYLADECCERLSRRWTNAETARMQRWFQLPQKEGLQEDGELIEEVSPITGLSDLTKGL